ncbi:alpha/beta fold hydrolase [Microbulbifer agarilyticus]|uniref:alpha/beta fold hydrolase n=1 Tax=Microbulbifer agarilyticus TaxID=260552 RepID=UPI001CD69B6A|nr:alpha/beta hydrolase [Microbulbifer agarilyticus]MCA0892656.1 alpha/beta hydrolase [Microbulbifer agarilyticus]
MKKSDAPSAINFFDRTNANILALVTPEIPRLNKVRKENDYSERPTFSAPPAMPLQYEIVHDVKIRYAHVGSSEKPTLVMLAPFPQSIIAYAPIWPLLAKEFHLYAFDMPGFGRSEGGKEFMNFSAQGDFLNSLIQHFKIENPHLLGPDVGMPAILYYAGTYDEKIASIIVGDGPAISPSSNASIIHKMVESPFWRLIFRIAGAGALVEAGRRICYVNYCPNDIELSDYKKSYSGRVSAALHWFKNYPESLATVDPLLESIASPTLLFWGDEDAILLPDNAVRIQKRMPNAKLHIFERCGHFCYQDRAEEFTAMVIDWIRKHD